MTTTENTLNPMIQKNLSKLAIEVWKIEKRILKLEDRITKEELQSLSFLVNRIYTILENYQIRVFDYNGQRYMEGMNGIEVMAVENEWDSKDAIIGESITPVLEINGQLAQRSKVIIKNTLTLSEEKLSTPTIESEGVSSGCAARRACAKNLRKVLGFGVFGILGFIIGFFVSETKPQETLEQAPILVPLEQIDEKMASEETITEEVINNDTNYQLDFEQLIATKQLDKEKLQELENLWPYDLFNYLWLDRKTDSKKFGIVPWNPSNNLLIKKSLLTELSKHIQ